MRIIGKFKDGVQEGYGIEYTSDGGVVEGIWEEKTVEGFGIFYYFNGDKYEGEWKNSKRKDMEFIIILIEIDMKAN